MKNILAFRVSLGTGNGLHDLRLTVASYAPYDNTFSDNKPPVPLLEQPFRLRDWEFDFRWQANENGDNPGWYGLRTAIKSARLPDLSIARRVIAALNKAGGPESPDDVIAAFAAAGIGQVVYSNTFNNFVMASDFVKADSFRAYYEVGVKDGGGGCCVNAYAPAGSSDEQITAAVSAALRVSRYCTDEQYVKWVAGGKRWSPAYRSPSTHNRVYTVDEIMAKAAAPAAA